jgi:cytoskeletal protein RodZ
MTNTPKIIVENSSLIPWLSLGASAILALITLWYVILTSQMLKQSQAIEAARKKAQVEGQASQIAAWVSSSAVEDRQVTVQTTLLNPTSQAVYDVEVSVVDMDGGALPSAPHSVAVLGPGDRLVNETRCRLPPNAGGSLRTSLTFVDNRGIRWQRGEDGELGLI